MASRSPRLRALALAALLPAAGCGPSGPETYRVEGVVRGVDAAERQVRVAHEDIPGFMPAMTMNFALHETAPLEGLEPGLRIRFELEREGTRLTITAWEPLGPAGEAGASGPLGLAPGEEPAPDFRLVDQDGRALALSDLRGKAVLLDFVFTRCPGPCPVLTSKLASLQRRLGPLGERTHLVSVTVDPEYDTPERLRAYALARGADLDGWSFLTGEPEAVRAAARDFHVGTIRAADGALDHLIVTFLIDPEGRIVERYLGTEHSAEEMLADLERVLS